jgi:hypothetical protein
MLDGKMGSDKKMNDWLWVIGIYLAGVILSFWILSLGTFAYRGYTTEYRKTFYLSLLWPLLLIVILSMAVERLLRYMMR